MYRHLRYLSVFTTTLLISTISPLHLADYPFEVQAVSAQMQTKQQRSDDALRLLNVGVQQLNKGQFREALATFEQTLIIVRVIGEREGEGMALHGIGAVYRHLGQYAKALEYSQQALLLRNTFIGGR